MWASGKLTAKAFTAAGKGFRTVLDSKLAQKFSTAIKNNLCDLVAGEFSTEAALENIFHDAGAVMPDSLVDLVRADPVKVGNNLVGKFEKVAKSVDFAFVGKISQGAEVSEGEIKAFIKSSPYAKEFEQLEQTVENLNKVVKDNRPGWLEKIENSVVLNEKLEKEAAELYNQFRKITNDVDTIAKNTGISKKVIQQIKDHMFIQEHLLGYTDTKGGISLLAKAQFAPGIDLAKVWTRLIDGNFVQSDLRLLLHELTESIIMKKYLLVTGNDIAYTKAHTAANLLHNWQSFVS